MDEEIVRNASDEQQIKKAGQRAKSKHEEEVADLKTILSMPQGKRLLWRYLEFCGVFKLSYSHSNDHTNFQEGKRNVGLRLLDEITEASPESLILMMQHKGVSDG